MPPQTRNPHDGRPVLLLKSLLDMRQSLAVEPSFPLTLAPLPLN